MQLTHFGHSCLLAEFDHTSVLFDPGTFAHGFEGITGLSAILVTHQHPDHVDPARLPSLLEANPEAALYADPQTTAQLDAPCQVVHVGDELRVGELTVRAARRAPRGDPPGNPCDREHFVSGGRRRPSGQVDASR